MKRILILLTIILCVAGLAVAEESTLIDFSLLVGDTEGETANSPKQNGRTMMDFSKSLDKTGGSITDEQKAVMKTSLAIGNWDVKLNASALRRDNVMGSYAKEANSTKVYSGPVMGVRVHFPLEAWNSSAQVRPPFEIPAFERKEGGDDPNASTAGTNEPSKFEEGYGVIKNVGAIKSIAVNVYGLNFPHGLWIYYLDQEGIEKEIFMGYLNFDGWGQLVWQNPQYVEEVRHRELKVTPLYPNSHPFIKFNGFRLERNGTREGGDFVTYLKDVKVIYDKAVVDTERDIDDEGTWGIIKTREDGKRASEMKNFGQTQVLRYIDEQTKAKEKGDFKPTEDSEPQ